ncbi:MFS transporter [Brevibacterium ravenspurgense]|nr:MFS transporter [Brevibacterium ravenspurgense]
MPAVSAARVPRRGFLIALAATIFVMVAASAPSLFYPQIADRLGLTPVATTLIFAVYAFTLLAVLLCLGSVSDRVGRRAVVTAGSVLLSLSLIMFWFAGSLTVFIAARALQGVAAGLLIPTLSAMMIDFEPETRPDSAALWNTIGPMLGLGTGTLSAAVLIDLTSDPSAVVFGILAAFFAIMGFAVWTTPERVTRTAITLADLRPQFHVPARLRQAFIAGVPAIIAGWATNGLFLALGAGLVRNELGGATHAHAGVALFVFAIAGVLTSRALYRRPARIISISATGALTLGTAASLGALALHSYPAYVISLAAVGSGFGTAFLGVLRTIMPLTAASERAAVMSVVYTVSYLAFGVPTIIAGLLVPLLTLSGTMILLGGVVVLLSAAATILRLRVRDQGGPETNPAGQSSEHRRAEAPRGKQHPTDPDITAERRKP